MQKKSKKTLITATIISTILILTSSLAATKLCFFKKKQSKNELQTVNVKEVESYEYLVKNIDGKIAVFEKNNNNPISILEKRTNELPEIDQNLLSEGIYLKNIHELNSIVDDYGD